MCRAFLTTKLIYVFVPDNAEPDNSFVFVPVLACASDAHPITFLRRFRLTCTISLSLKPRILYLVLTKITLANLTNKCQCSIVLQLEFFAIFSPVSRVDWSNVIYN